MHCKLFFATAAVSWSGVLLALGPQSHDDIPYLGAAYLYEIPDSDRDSDHGQGFQLHAGYPLRAQGYPRLSAELTVHSLERERQIDGRKDYQTGVLADLVYELSEPGHAAAIKPYLLGGLGLVQNDVRGDKHQRLGVNVGGGLLLPLAPYLDWHGLAVRVEARALLSVNDPSSSDAYPSDYRISAGLQLPLFFLYPQRAPVVPAPAECELAVVDPLSGRSDCQADSDQDSVPDEADQCPATPQGTSVDGKGCPIALPLKTPPSADELTVEPLPSGSGG